MALPIRTTLEDIEKICEYLATKPTGASESEAKSVLGQRRLSPYKLSALRAWGLLNEPAEEGRLVLSPSGRELAKGPSWRRSVLGAVIKNIPPYNSIVERAHMERAEFVTSTDVAAQWFEHFREFASDSERIINDQAVCFFHVASGAELGVMTSGRVRQPTRLNFVRESVESFIRNRGSSAPVSDIADKRPFQPPQTQPEHRPVSVVQETEAPNTASYLRRGLEIDCYRLNSRLGSGFSAEVWSAHVVRTPVGVDLQPEQEVAIKFYSANALAIPDQVIRVEREYRLAQRLRHPHLIRIFEFLLASPRPHHNFLVMDLAPGPTLSSVIAGGTKFETDKALKIVAQVFSGAEALHDAGALHRDIKPGNIAINLGDNPESSPHCVLLDLGIISPLFEKGITAVSRFVGSKHWAPLEQLIGEHLDPRSDLYSVGAVAYNLLMKTEPFSGSATEAAVAVAMSKSALRVAELATLPSQITEMLNACLSNRPSDRPRSAQECLAVLRAHGIEP